MGRQVTLVADFLWCCVGRPAVSLPCDADTAASAASSSVIVDIVNSHQDVDTANTNLPAAPAGLHLLVHMVHKAICGSACMTYAWACLSYSSRQDAASCSVIPGYGPAYRHLPFGSSFCASFAVMPSTAVQNAV